MTDTPNQHVQVLTPGATDARCLLTTNYAKFLVHPPETIFIRRMQEPLKVVCTAPGNRTRTTFAYPKKNGAALGNVITGGLSTAYDHFSGALYEYPSPIIVDFRHTIATGYPLPNYYAPDTVSPLDQNPFQVKGLPTHPSFGDTPAALIEKDDEATNDSTEDSEKLDNSDVQKSDSSQTLSK